MKVLVTGSKGQVGSLVSKKLKNEIELLAIDFDELDITDETAVHECINAFQPNVVINCAAHTAVDKAEEESDLSYRINCDGPRFLARAAKNVDAVIIHISTDYVFSGDNTEAYIETDITAPQSVYGASKLAGELAVAEENPKHLILRTAWVFGEVGNNFVKTMLRLGRERQELGVIADQFGGPTYAGDIADTLITMAKSSQYVSCPWGVYNFSGMPYVSWHQFAKHIFAQAKSQGALANAPRVNAITTAEYPTAAKRPANSKLNCDKIFHTFDIRSSDWQSALQQIKDYQ